MNDEAADLRRAVRMARYLALCTPAPEDARTPYDDVFVGDVVGVLPHGEYLFTNGCTVCKSCRFVIWCHDGLFEPGPFMGLCQQCRANLMAYSSTPTTYSYSLGPTDSTGGGLVFYLDNKTSGNL